MKKLATVGVVALSVVALTACSSETSKDVKTKVSQTVQKVKQKAEDKKEVAKVPLEYRTAVKKAQDYLSTVGMSKQGLEKQLVDFEKFSPEAAKYAVEHVKVNWNEQALKKAKDYVKNVSLSPEATRTQLIDFEHFTPEEAQYAIDHLEK